MTYSPRIIKKFAFVPIFWGPKALREALDVLREPRANIPKRHMYSVSGSTAIFKIASNAE